MTIDRPWYTGVGARDGVPVQVLDAMTSLASWLESTGFGLRSGGARGSDEAFEKGVLDDRNKKIYDARYSSKIDEATWQRAVTIALDHLTNDYHRKAAMKYIDLIGRVPFQVLGDDLHHPSKFLACWTKNGKDISGTGTTIRVARSFNVPVYNLFSMTREEIMEIIDRDFGTCR